MTATVTTRKPELAGDLQDAGFQLGRGGDYRSGKFRLRLRNGWAILTDQRKTPRDLFDTAAPLAGPWRFAYVAGKLAKVAEFPLVSFETTNTFDFDSPPDTKPCLSHFLDWATQSAVGKSFTKWHAPMDETIQSWIGDGQLTIQLDLHARQIEVRRTDTELALRVPIVAEVPPDLPADRESWLRRVLIETQSQFRMVRAYVAHDGPHRSAVAEIVLTGAPPAILESMLAVGLRSLASALQWSVRSADLLTDLNVTCHVWEVRQPFHSFS